VRYHLAMPRKPDPEIEASRQEAERLSQLAPEVQRQVLAIIRSPADDPRLPKADREAARRRADAVAKFLRHLNRRRRK